MKLPKFDWKNIKWFDAKPTKEKAVIGGAVILVGLGLYSLGERAPSRPAEQPGVAPERSEAVAGNPIPLQKLSASRCFTFAPQGWRVTDSNPEGSVFGAASADGSEIAGYGVVGVNGGMAQSGFYGPQYRTPESLVLYMISSGMIREQAEYVGEEKTFGYYRAREFRSPQHQGYVLVYSIPIAGDPGGYVVEMRVAIGGPDNPRSVAAAGSVAAAMRCAVKPKPAQTFDISRSTSGTHDTGKSGDDDVTMAGTYNAQLGTGWVHDPATGDNYNVDVTNDYSASGPDGPGFYKRNGNDLIKLENGLSD